MRIANSGGRLTIITDDGSIDVESASGGMFSADPQAVYDQWDQFVSWADGANAVPNGPAVDPRELGAPVPRPPQVLAVGLNYRAHAEESGLDLPDEPAVFAKFVSCLAGPYAEIAVDDGAWVDWEVELVVVMGRRADRISAADAWAHVAGITVGQDISDRLLQFRGSAPQQFTLGKSRPGFGPIGPWVVTLEDIEDPDDLAIECSIDGEVLQSASTRDMIFSVPEIIARTSALMTLLPGDVIFTGTPSGIGAGRKPPRFLTSGQTLSSRIHGVGEMHNPIVAADQANPV